MSGCAVVDTPLGAVSVVERSGAIVEVGFGARAGVAGGSTPLLDEAVRQIDAYFAGELDRFDLPLSPAGTEFQQRVWDALLEVPPGTTTTYQAIAHKLGSAARAVGLANGANPIGIVIPCHRVIGADGSLTGYAGGLDRKRWLLRHEGALLV